MYSPTSGLAVAGVNWFRKSRIGCAGANKYYVRITALIASSVALASELGNLVFDAKLTLRTLSIDATSGLKNRNNTVASDGMTASIRLHQINRGYRCRRAALPGYQL